MRLLRLSPRYLDAAPIDADREHGLIALNSTVSSTSQNALPISGFYINGLGALAIANVDSSGNITGTDAGKTLKNASGSVNSSGDNTLIVAGTHRLKIYAFSLSTPSTTALTCIFQSGAGGGTELWRVILQTPTSVTTGANLAISPPAWLFATASATLLNLNLSSGQTVHYSVSYFDEA